MDASSILRSALLSSSPSDGFKVLCNVHSGNLKSLKLQSNIFGTSLPSESLVIRNCNARSIQPIKATITEIPLPLQICPLVLPDVRHVAKACGDGIKNKTACCDAMGVYVSHLLRQSFITNLQTLNSAETLAMKLQKSNITEDV